MSTEIKSPLPVIILQYGQFDLTRDCIASVRAQTVPVEVVLVDGCSPGRTPAILAALGKLADQAIFLEENLGYAGGNNVAIQRVMAQGAPAFVILNNDTVLEPDCLEALLASYRLHEEGALFVPRVLYPDGRLQSAGGTLRRPLFEARLVGHLGDPAAFSEERPVLYAPGVAVLVRAEAVEEVGLIPELYFMYGEDVDWSLRFHTAGWESWYVPQAQLVHYDSASSGSYSERKGYALHRSAVLLARQWAVPGEWWQFCMSYTVKLLKQTVKFRRYRGYVRGMWRGSLAGLAEARQHAREQTDE